MESKKLPVLWMDASDPILKDHHEHVISGVVLTNRPYLTNREPYIPVARVREMIEHLRAESFVLNSALGRAALALEIRRLERLIDDVEDK